MVGLFINTLPVRVCYAPGDTVAELLTDCRAGRPSPGDHHHYGLPEIQQAAGVRASLFDTLVVFESYPVDREGLGAASDAADGIDLHRPAPVAGTHYPLCPDAAGRPAPPARHPVRTGGVFDRDTVELHAARPRASFLRQLATTPT